MSTENWFSDWFDTEYYHMLYRSRDEREAEHFIANLLGLLQLDHGSAVLDLACGKGRHSITLNKAGLHVTGADLSANSIQAARQFENPSLEFIVHDMREVLPERKFKAIFNLFTSFGYFDELSDNDKVMRAVGQMLDTHGLFVIDFMNVERVLAHLVPEEDKIIDGVHFRLRRKYDGMHIYKEIRFETRDGSHQYTERVQALRLPDFEKLLSENGFELIHTFGDFELSPFDVNTAERLILIARKL